MINIGGGLYMGFVDNKKNMKTTNSVLLEMLMWWLRYEMYLILKKYIYIIFQTTKGWFLDKLLWSGI